MLDKFADELKAARERKGISLQQMAARSRIDLKFLEAIDNGNFSFLPELYVKAFLKQYAKTVGLDEEETVIRYEDAKAGRYSGKPESVSEDKKEVKRSEDKTVKPVTAPAKKTEPIKAFTDPSLQHAGMEKKDKKKLAITVLASVTGGVLLTLIVYFLFFKNNSEIVVEEKPYDEVLEQTNERYNVEEDKMPEQTVSAETDSLMLTIRNTDQHDSAWVLVIYDDKNKEDFILVPNRSKTVKAAASFKLTLGNSGVIALELNNQPVDFDGRKNSVRHFKIDSSGIERLYSPPTIIKE